MSSPSVPTRAVDISESLTAPAVESWAGVHALAEQIGPEHWSLVGGQMVLVHLAPHSDLHHRPTADADIAVDVRAGRRSLMTRISNALTDAGFTSEHSPEGVTQFIRGAGRIDLLAPEGMSSPVRTIDGGRAISAPGATQALNRSELVEVTWSDERTTVQVPTLFAALVAKAAAAIGTHEGRARRQRHLDDIVALGAVMVRSGQGTKPGRRRTGSESSGRSSSLTIGTPPGSGSTTGHLYGRCWRRSSNAELRVLAQTGSRDVEQKADDVG